MSIAIIIIVLVSLLVIIECRSTHNNPTKGESRLLEKISSIIVSGYGCCESFILFSSFTIGSIASASSIIILR